MKQSSTLAFVKPLPKLNRQLPEKEALPKGMIPQREWEKKTFRKQFQESKG